MIFYRLIFPFTSVVNITVFNGIINNSLTDITAAELPCEADIYMLSGGNDIRSRVMYLGGTPLKISENGELPEFTAKHQNAGNIELAPGTCTFIVI